MPRLERTVLLGYLPEVRRGKGHIPSPDRPGAFTEIEVIELVLTDELGDQVVFPMDEQLRQLVIQELTGGLVVP